MVCANLYYAPQIKSTVTPQPNISHMSPSYRYLNYKL